MLAPFTCWRVMECMNWGEFYLRFIFSKVDNVDEGRGAEAVHDKFHC